MLDYHRQLYQKVGKLDYTMRNKIDMPHSTEAYALQKQINAFKTGIQKGEHARTLEARAKTIDMAIHNAELKRTGLMSSVDTNQFRHQMKDMIYKDIRRLPHY
jgi:hypothetical protein